MIQKDRVKEYIVKELLRKQIVTRPELAKTLSIRPATLFEIINGLKARGILAEPERKGKRTGRKASPICINKEYGTFLGIDFKPAYISAVLIDARGNICSSKHLVSKPGKDAKQGMEEISQVIDAIKGGAAEPWKKLRGIGFADPGVVNSRDGIAVKAVNIQGWKNIKLQSFFREKYEVQSIVYPNSSIRAYMEYLDHQLSRGESLFHMELGVGIGGGFIKDGEVFIGDNFAAMEVGHIIVDENSGLCQCGNRGCLEIIAGEGGIRKGVKTALSHGVHTALGEQEFSVPFFVQCVKENDKTAVIQAHNISEMIGVALASVVSLLNPTVIVFSGPLAELGDFLISSVSRILSLRCLPMALEKMRLSVSTLPIEATALGAALLMREKDLLSVI